LTTNWSGVFSSNTPKRRAIMLLPKVPDYITSTIPSP
jgi:hypothetical protein